MSDGLREARHAWLASQEAAQRFGFVPFDRKDPMNLDLYLPTKDIAATPKPGLNTQAGPPWPHFTTWVRSC